MKRLFFSIAVPVALLFAVVAQAPAPTSEIAAEHQTPNKHCNFVVVGKAASADGSVLMGYNNDWSANNYTYLQVVPGDATKHRFVKILTLGAIPEGGINEHKLGVNYGTFTTLDRAVLAADPYVKKGYGGELWDLLLQQATTAQQAIDLLEQMANTKGFGSGAAGSFAVADPNEAWLFELLGGRHWVAMRVPDDAVLAHPNTLTIRQVNLADPAHFRGSADLAAFAQSIGRYDPASGPLDVAVAFADAADLVDYTNTNRMWTVYNRFAPAQGFQPSMPLATRPVYVVPEHDVTLQDVMAATRDHFEGTSLDQTQGYTLMSPHDQTDRPTCYSYTDYSAVWQLRGWLPDAVGGVLWLAPSRPCSSTFTPFYGANTSVPAAFTGKTAYNAFRAVADSLDKRGTVGGEIRYKHYLPTVRGVYGAFESEVASAQSSVETTAAAMAPADQVVYLTNYSNQRATQAYNLALGLPAQMP